MACGPARRNALPGLTAPQWQDGETSTYEVVRADSILFERVTQVRFDEESGKPSIRVTSVVRSRQAEVFFHDSTVFALRRFSLRPLWSFRAVRTAMAELEVAARYERGRVSVRKAFIEGEEERVLEAGADAFGVEVLPVVLRALELTPGATFALKAVVGLELRVVPTEVTVLGTRLAVTPVGDILCREVELRSNRRRVSLLFELAEPHRLVALEDEENESETRLVGYAAAGAERAPVP